MSIPITPIAQKAIRRENKSATVVTLARLETP